MGPVSEHEYTTYPRRFTSYKWFKPLLVVVLFIIFYFVFNLLIKILTKTIFGTAISSSGYDDMDFYSATGAFENGARAAVYIPSILLAALIVKDRPISSYFSSMGGWRWEVFFKTFAAAFVILGIPSIVWFMMRGEIHEVLFTVGGFILLALFIPLQGVSEELLCRGFFTQTISSWFMLPALGIAVQVMFFISTHPYNIIGKIEIGVSALIYALVCVFTKGLEAGSALHIVNNMTEIFMAGFGFGLITAEQTVPNIIFNVGLKIVYCIFIFYAYKKLHWFDKVQYDDVAAFNVKTQKQ